MINYSASSSLLVYQGMFRALDPTPPRLIYEVHFLDL